MNHGGHESKNSTCSLKLCQCGPIPIKPVKNLRMDRIGVLDPLLVISVPTFGGKFLLLTPVHIPKSPGYHIPLFKLIRIGYRFKEPSLDNLEAEAGRQKDSIRPTTFLRRSSTSLPRIPPTATSSVWEWDIPVVSEAGRLTTRKHLFASLPNSVRT